MAISFLAAGAWASGSTSVAPALPAGASANTRMVLFVGCKPFNATINTPSGWTELAAGGGTNGSVANGVDTGSVRWATFYRDWQSGDGAPTVSVTSGNVTLASIRGFDKGAGDTWDTPVAGKGSDTTSGTGFSITSDVNLGIAAGDYLVHGAVIAGNNATFGTPTLTATGCTFGAVTESPATEGSTATGNDLEASASYVNCTAGPSSAAPVAGWTLSVAQTGGGSITRLRVTAGDTQVPVSDSGTGTDSASVAASTTSADAGTGGDTAAIGATASPTDTSSGTDQAALNAAAGLSDTAAGADARSLAVSLAIADSASGTDGVSVDTGSLPVNVSDSATGTDAASTTASTTPSDTSAGADQAAVNAAQGISDIAAGAETPTAAVSIAVADAATGADAVAVDTGNQDAAFERADLATGSDAITIEVINAVMIPLGWEAFGSPAPRGREEPTKRRTLRAPKRQARDERVSEPKLPTPIAATDAAVGSSALALSIIEQGLFRTRPVQRLVRSSPTARRSHEK